MISAVLRDFFIIARKMVARSFRIRQCILNGSTVDTVVLSMAGAWCETKHNIQSKRPFRFYTQWRLWRLSGQCRDSLNSLFVKLRVIFYVLDYQSQGKRGSSPITAPITRTDRVSLWATWHGSSRSLCRQIPHTMQSALWK